MLYTHSHGLDSIIEADYYRTTAKFFEFYVDKEVIRTLRLDRVVQIKRLTEEEAAAALHNYSKDETFGAVLVPGEVNQLSALLASVHQEDQLDELLDSMPGSKELNELVAALPNGSELNALIRSFDLPD